MELEGKVAIVTGASLGIGSACALDLAGNGANVAINYRKHDAEANAICEQINSMGRRGLAIRADVANFQDAQNMVDTVVKEFGRAAVTRGFCRKLELLWRKEDEPGTTMSPSISNRGVPGDQCVR